MLDREKKLVLIILGLYIYIIQTNDYSWHIRTLAQDFYRFRIIQPEFRPHWAWYFSKSRRKRLIPCTSVVLMTANLTDVRQTIQFAMLAIHVTTIWSIIVYMVVDRAKLWHDISGISMNSYAF